FIIIVFFLFFFFFPAEPQDHPLDTLTQQEITTIRSVILAHFPDSAETNNLTFHYVALEDPSKSSVLSWKSDPGRRLLPPRRAAVTLRVDRTTRVVVVDLAGGGSVASDEAYGGTGYPMLSVEEQEFASRIARGYPPFAAAMERRGLKLEEIVCSSYTVGWYGEEEGRIVRVMCGYKEGTPNFYMRPIEGVTVTVDLDERRIVGFKDRVTVPVPKAEGTDYTEPAGRKSHGDGRALRQDSHSDRPNFSLDGHVLR
ncbi:primary amine oxidase, partial [Genlisea aurea]